MRAFLLLSLSLSLCSAALVGTLPSWSKAITFNLDSFSHCFVEDTSLDPVPNLLLCWTVDQGSETITFGVAGLTRGDGTEDGRGMYVALGVTEGGMSGADIAVFSPSLGLQDRFSVKQARPSMDPEGQQDLTLVSGNYFELPDSSVGVTSFVFSRSLRVCEGHQTYDLDITTGMNFIIWAIGAVANNNINFHGTRRGSLTLNLLADEGSPPHKLLHKYPPPDVSFPEIDMKMDNGYGAPFPLKAGTRGVLEGQDAYVCLAKAVPQFASKIHVTEIEAVVTDPEFVHHMILYRCTSTPKTFLPGVCSMSNCDSLIGTWAPGSYGAYRFPDNIGYPLAEGGRQEYLLLQVHYNFPRDPLDAVDSSGFILRYSQPRQIDAGIFAFGWLTSNLMQIPGGSKPGPSTTFTGFLPTECLGNRIPVDGISLLDGAVHMHKYGSQGKVQQYRNNAELIPLANRRVFDFNYQHFSDLEGNKIMRGDLLKLTCVYDTTSTTKTVYGGENTNQEMCLYFFAYYPKLQTNNDFILTFSKSGQTYCQNGQIVMVSQSRYTNLVSPSEDRLECGTRRQAGNVTEY